MRTLMEIHSSLLCTSTRPDVTGNLPKSGRCVVQKLKGRLCPWTNLRTLAHFAREGSARRAVLEGLQVLRLDPHACQTTHHLSKTTRH